MSFSRVPDYNRNQTRLTTVPRLFSAELNVPSCLKVFYMYLVAELSQQTAVSPRQAWQAWRAAD